MSIPRHWRLQGQLYQMVGEVCNQCGAKLFPPRDVCPECSKPAYEPYTYSGRGTVYSYSTIFQAPVGYEEFVPYTVALIRLDEGPLVSAHRPGSSRALTRCWCAAALSRGLPS